MSLKGADILARCYWDPHKDPVLCHVPVGLGESEEGIREETRRDALRIAYRGRIFAPNRYPFLQ